MTTIDTTTPESASATNSNPPSSTRVASAGRAGISGLVAAAGALAAGELVTGFAGEPSLVSLVGDTVIDLTPGSGAQQANSVLGSSNKPALIIGTIVLSLMFGYVLGQVSRRRNWPAVVGFVGFGLVGIWAGARSSIASTPIESVAAVVAVLTGVVSYFFLRGRAAAASGTEVGATVASSKAAKAGTAGSSEPTDFAAEVKLDPTEDLNTDTSNLAPEPIVVPPMATPAGAGMASMPAARRRFLAWAGGGAAAAGATALAGRSLSSRASVEGARSEVVLPEATNRTTTAPSTTAAETSTTSPSLDRFLDNDVPNITPMVVPNDEFYRIDTALVVPQVDPATWKLSIGGMVDEPFELTFDELLAMDQVEEAVTLSCVSNPVGGDLVGNAVWQGVPLLDVLERAGIQPGAEQVVSSSVDGWSCGFPLEVLNDGRPALIAVAQNGEPLPVIHGFPARLVISGLYGYVSATKWLSNIRLDTWDNFDGYWIPRGWSKLGPIKTQSRIDVPSRRDVEAGPQAIAGVAWAGERGIDRVEVRIDDGDWQVCTLGEEMARTSWRQWKLDWDAQPGRHVIQVRATDGDGQVQTSDLANVAPNGATGHHTIGVTVA